MKKIALIALLSIIYCLSATSEDRQNRQLTLEESIEIAKQKSLRMLKLEQSLKGAEFNLKSATNSLRTNIEMTLELPRYSEEVRTREDSSGISYYSFKQVQYEGNLTIRQPLPTDGNIFIQNRLTSYDDIQRDLRSTYASTRIGLEQPIDAFYGFNRIRSTLQRAKLAYEQSSKSYKRAELNLIYDVSSSYYNLLLLQKSAEIRLLDLERQTNAFEISQKKYDAGLIREVDALQMEVDLAEAQSNHDIALLNQSSAVNSFKELLGINLNDSITLKSELNYEIVLISPDLAVRYALENRLEIREQEIQIELQQLNIDQQKAAGMVKASLNAYFEKLGVNQEYNKGLFSSAGDSYRNYSDRPSNYGVGFSLRIPIFDWGVNRARVRENESRLQEIIYTKQEVERGIETEVTTLVSRINSNLKRLQLLEKNVKVAEKSFDITLQRYTDGDIDSDALALERNRMNTAYTSHLNAYINYQLSLADLMRKTFFDFRNQTLIE